MESQRNLLVQPDREAAGLLPALEDLFREAARDIRTKLVNRSGADVPVRLGMAQVTTVSGLLDDTDARDGGVFGIFRFHPLGLPGLFVVQGRLLSRLVGVLLGEDPESEPPPYRVRPVTRVEMRFCRRILNDVLRSVTGAWPTNPRPRLEIESMGPGPRMADSLTATTAMLTASLDFGRPDEPWGLLTLAIPAQAARDLRVTKIEAIPAEVKARRYNADRVMPLPVTAIAELARTRLTLGQLEQLEEGCLIEIGARQSAKLRVGGKIVLEGEPGRSSGMHGLRVLRRTSGPGPEGSS